MKSFILLTGLCGLLFFSSCEIDKKRVVEKKQDEKKENTNAVVLHKSFSLEPSDIIKTSDGYIICGSIINHGGFIMKLDENLIEQWYKDFEGIVYSVADNKKDAILIAGEEQNGAPWVARLNYQGDIQWMKTLQISSFEIGCVNKIIAVSNDNYVIAGWKNESGTDFYTDAFIAKINQHGDIDTNDCCWELIVDNPGSLFDYDEAVDVIEVMEEGMSNYLVCGYSAKVVSNEDAWFMKLNERGEIVYKKDFKNEEGPCRINSIIELEDGIAGTGMWNNNKIWFVKIEKNGSAILFDHKYNSTLNYITAGTKVFRTSDGGFIASGYDIGNMPSGWIMKWSKSELEWFKYLGPVQQLFAIQSLVETEDGSYVLTGSINNEQANKDILVLETDKDGNCVGCFEAN